MLDDDDKSEMLNRNKFQKSLTISDSQAKTPFHNKPTPRRPQIVPVQTIHWKWFEKAC